MKSFDLTVVGAGPGGYVAAIRAAQLGMTVALIDRGKPGGTCLHSGCIPSKIMLQHGGRLEEIRQAQEWGIETSIVQVDDRKLFQRQNTIIQSLSTGIAHLLKKNRITFFQGEATIDGSQRLVCDGHIIQSKNMLLATGGKPFIPPIAHLETIDYMTTDTFFQQTSLPKSLVIIGGGVIAVELAFAVSPFGTKVTILEVAPDILQTEDEEARAIVKEQLQQRGVEIQTNVVIENVQQGLVRTANAAFPFERLLVAAGRRPNTELADALHLQKDTNNPFIKVNQYYETSKKGIYAIGDVIGKYELAHAASAEGIAAVEHMAGIKQQPIDELGIPRCVYTDPEIASFGLSEKEAKEQGYDVSVSFSANAANGKALAEGDTAGFVKLITEKKYGELLGAVIVGKHATELIGELLAIRVSEGTISELQTLIHAHPTIAEVIGESALAFSKRAIHQ